MKKLLAGVIASSMLLSTAQAATVTFPDVSESDWYYSKVIQARDYGMMNGVTAVVDGQANFAPSASMKRSEFLVAVLRLTMPERVAELEAASAGDYWWKPFLKLALETGILWENEFSFDRLDGNVQRQEAAMMLIRAVNYVKAPSVDLIDTKALMDYKDISTYYQPFVRECVSRKLMVGDTKSYFWPTRELSRGECAVVLVGLAESNENLLSNVT